MNYLSFIMLPVVLPLKSHLDPVLHHNYLQTSTMSHQRFKLTVGQLVPSLWFVSLVLNSLISLFHICDISVQSLPCWAMVWFSFSIFAPLLLISHLPVKCLSTPPSGTGSSKPLPWPAHHHPCHSAPLPCGQHTGAERWLQRWCETHCSWTKITARTSNKSEVNGNKLASSPVAELTGKMHQVNYHSPRCTGIILHCCILILIICSCIIRDVCSIIKSKIGMLLMVEQCLLPFLIPLLMKQPTLAC